MEADLPDGSRRIDWTRTDGRSSRVTVTEDVEVHPEANCQGSWRGAANAEMSASADLGAFSVLNGLFGRTFG
jgi:hypothetical protein